MHNSTKAFIGIIASVSAFAFFIGGRAYQDTMDTSPRVSLYFSSSTAMHETAVKIQGSTPMCLQGELTNRGQVALPLYHLTSCRHERATVCPTDASKAVGICSADYEATLLNEAPTAPYSDEFTR
jgi:hypothetical protein